MEQVDKSHEMGIEIFFLHLALSSARNGSRVAKEARRGGGRKFGGATGELARQRVAPLKHENKLAARARRPANFGTKLPAPTECARRPGSGRQMGEQMGAERARVPANFSPGCRAASQMIDLIRYTHARAPPAARTDSSVCLRSEPAGARGRAQKCHERATPARPVLSKLELEKLGAGGRALGKKRQARCQEALACWRRSIGGAAARA